MIIIMIVKINVVVLLVIIVIECEIEEFIWNKKYIINKLWNKGRILIYYNGIVKL